ncbi:hypothetical protein, partial [Phocaeicola massiliensis]|uniref:hypothetical protein n=1 Tax=Phocaeicola massiliensis TaxID=204516 RepID=UPI0034A1B731
AFSSGAKDILQKIQKRDTAQIRDENNSKMKLTEANQRLRKKTHSYTQSSNGKTKNYIPKDILRPTKAIRFNPLPSPKGERPNGSLTQWSVAQC